MDKPISLQIEEAKQNIINTINEQNMNVTILDMIIKDIYNEVHMLSIQQYEKDKEEYENSLKEENNGVE